MTLRISGFFRDAFPHVVDLLDDAVQLVAGLDEPAESNFLRAHVVADLAEGADERRAWRAHWWAPRPHRRKRPAATSLHRR